ncbi:prepilin-type N-terminal cleavage/methylation domain-containing protein [uncultured Desulfuromonas sp.]|uniref:prepilin-type N-terminal cleavage/methylation domain-containing protein n=1 Tax=uncultured Desulfuromonas sp. TaxID=181013 RepID=UPI002AAABAB3|nr:prepilin-type N-terminal cleavage/methylation domain-containing protein [uncultured Desulfuromonas sp.]
MSLTTATTVSDQRSASRQCGFTLLEVMIALAIIGSALIACLSLANRSVFSNDEVQRITTATMLAQHKMSELETESRLGELDTSELEGDWEEPYQQYRWQVEYSATPVSGVQQVTVSVLWGKKARNEEVTLDSFLFN